MADPKGFLTTPREEWPRRPAGERVRDWDEVYVPGALLPIVGRQADRCMDCGVPFCHEACPLGNLIPEWNDLVSRSDWRAASERLHATNNFPEFTGRLCPAPCEAGCVLAINQPAVTIKNVECAIADTAWEEGFVPPLPPERLSGRTVAVIGSGPAGLAAAQQLTRAGHTVAVYERDDRIGGLLRYGIPAFKMEKRHLERRVGQMRAEGTRFRTSAAVGRDVDAAALRTRYDAVVIATGATAWRELTVPGRELAGVHQAMEYLPLANRVCEGDLERSPLSAAGRHVVVVGGGDTGADCLGTAVREGAASVTQLDIYARPGAERDERAEPWPTYPRLYRLSAAHEEARACGPRRRRTRTRGCSRRPRSASPATSGGMYVRCTWSGWTRDAVRCPAASGRSRRTWSFSPSASRGPTGTTGSSTGWDWTWSPVARSPGTGASRPTSRGCSPPGTRRAGSHSSSGRSRRGGRWRRPWTATCPAAAPGCRPRSARTTGR